jgi:hypothetical protein
MHTNTQICMNHACTPHTLVYNFVLKRGEGGRSTSGGLSWQSNNPLTAVQLTTCAMRGPPLKSWMQSTTTRYLFFIKKNYHLSEERAAGEVMDAVLAVLEVRELCCAEDDGALRQEVGRETEKPRPGETVAGGGRGQSRRNAKPGAGEDIEDGEECQMTPELQTSSNACLPSASPRAAPKQALSIGRHTLLLTMFGQVLREEPMGSWSGRGSGASRMFMSCSHPASSCTGTDGAC